MDIIATSGFGLAGGVLAGLASSLHCLGMCGGIAGGLMIALPQDGAGGRFGTLAGLQAGRILSYALAGALVGLLGAQSVFAFDREAAHLVLRWLAAAILFFIGLSVAGWAPALSRFDALGRGVGARLAAGPGRWARHGGPLAAGAVWGFMPCGLVYAALLYAMFTGSASGGALVMVGFGLGTLPAVAAAALGAGRLVELARRPGWRRGIGATIAALAVLSVLLTPHTIRALCGLPAA